MDSFIIYAAQQSLTDSVSENEELPSLPPVTNSSVKMPWTQFSPSNIRLAPFPTREYTDDEFQSIIKTVMGVLYVSCITFLFMLRCYCVKKSSWVLKSPPVNGML